MRITLQSPTLRELRESLGMRLADVRDATGIDVGQLSRAERGLSGLGPSSMKSLALTYGVSGAQIAAAVARARSPRVKSRSPRGDLRSLREGLTRVGKSYSLVELGKLLGVSHVTILRMERGERVSEHLLRQLPELYGVSWAVVLAASRVSRARREVSVMAHRYRVPPKPSPFLVSSRPKESST